MSSVEQVITQMVDGGMPPLPPNHPVMDGKYKRFGPKNKAWYVLTETVLKSGRSVVTGAFGMMLQGANRNAVKVAVDLQSMTTQERTEFDAWQRERERAELEKRQMEKLLARNRANDQWNKAAGLPLVHPYLADKKIDAEGVRVSADGLLLIPMMRAGQMVGLQKIDRKGFVRYNKGMDRDGAYLMLGDPEWQRVIAIGVTYDSCRSVRMAMDNHLGLTVAVAFDAGAMTTVAQTIRKAYPTAHLLLLADDDHRLEAQFALHLMEEFKVLAPVPVDGERHTVTAENGTEVHVTATWSKDENGVPFIHTNIRAGRRVRKNIQYKNAGLANSAAAAKALGNASVAVPSFSARGDRALASYNDLHVEEGLATVAAQIGFSLLAAQQPGLGSPIPSGAPAPGGIASPQPEPAADGQPPPPPGTEHAAGRSDDDAETRAAHGERLVAALEAAYREDPDEDPIYDDDAASPSEGEGGKAKKEKPKKVYGPEHWDQVEYVLRNFVLVYGEDMVWDVGQRMLMKISSMRTIVANNDVMRFWAGDNRRWVLKKNIVFDPQETRSPDTSGPTATVNLFSGWKMKPKRGRCLQIQTLLLHLCDGNEELMTWVERWLAYPLRHRGAKMETSIIMHGDEGSGKNFFFEKVIKKIYGAYGYVIGNAQLESQFNDWASMKLFMVADEVVTRSELKHMKGKLKYLVSGDMIIINPKGLPEHGEANHMNFVFLSNELQPLALDKTDRRYLVIWTPPALSREFYIDVATEIDAGGIEAYFHYLLHELDMGDFNEHTKPLYTSAKDDLIEKSLTPAERFYRDWSRGFLPLPFITCGATQLYDAYKVWCDKSGESKYISQTIFTPTVLRYAGDALEKRVIKYEYGQEVKQRNVFLCGVKPADKSLSDWVADTSALFESHFMAYRRRSGVNVEG